MYCQYRWEEVYKPCLRGIGLVAALFMYLRWEDPSKIEFRYGLIVTILMLLLMGSPLMEIVSGLIHVFYHNKNYLQKEIMETKDASSIPFPIVFMGFFVSILWLIYGIILSNDFMIVCFIAVAIIIWFIYTVFLGAKCHWNIIMCYTVVSVL